MAFPTRFECFGELLDYLKRHPGEVKEQSPEWQKLMEKKLRATYEAMQKQAKLEPIYYWKPNLPQAKLFYSLNHQGQMPRILMFEGSNKSGKSTGAVAWQIAMGVGFFPWLELDKETGNIEHMEASRNWKLYRLITEYCGFGSHKELSERFHTIKGNLVPGLKVPNVNLALGETYTESVDKDLVPKYLELIPQTWKPETKKNQQGVISKISLKAGPGKGTIFYFRSYKSTPDEFEGIDVSGSILFNEPPPQDIVIAVSRGALPYDTRMMFAFTALKEPWIYRDYVYKASRWFI